MRKLLLAGAAILALGAVTPALADDASAAVGGSAGAATGATTGFFLGGPVGAVIGGVVGAGIGASVADQSAIDYARHHRVASVTYSGHLRPGYHVGRDIKLYRVPDDSNYSYVYVNDQPALIDNRTNTIVWIGD